MRFLVLQSGEESSCGRGTRSPSLPPSLSPSSPSFFPSPAVGTGVTVEASRGDPGPAGASMTRNLSSQAPCGVREQGSGQQGPWLCLGGRGDFLRRVRTSEGLGVTRKKDFSFGVSGTQLVPNPQRSQSFEHSAYTREVWVVTVCVCGTAIPCFKTLVPWHRFFLPETCHRPRAVGRAPAGRSQHLVCGWALDCLDLYPPVICWPLGYITSVVSQASLLLVFETFTVKMKHRYRCPTTQRSN